MQVANALNNTIRILFNPKVEKFRLFDFLIVKSLDDRYLAQIIEIYEDKFDSSQNVAKLKLFYKIAQNNEVMPYDNFTPSKECEIIKVKSDEVENFINNDKETFVFGTDAKNSQGLNVQYDFFNKNALILADKIENSNAISLNLAKKLSAKKHAVILDFTGIVEFEEAKTIKACKNFKMPLNYETIDSVFDRCLSDASLEFQAIGMEILNAIKQFAKKQDSQFIPFNAFINVILQQYKATPYSELQLLLVRMKKYQMNDVFAKNKKDYETLSKTIQKNPITIIDLSGLDSVWQKSYVDYIISELNEEIYLLTRINDDVFDNEIINEIYNKKTNINFVPSVSYNYSKLPTIIQYCKNYILMPSLNQRTDFLDANFALANIISDGCIIFGENTDNFLYLARDYELEIQEKRKNYRKIALSLSDENEETKITEEEPVSDSQKLMQELSNLEEQSIREYQEEKEEETHSEKTHDEFQEIIEETNTSQETVEEIQEIPQEIKTIQNIQEIKLSNDPSERQFIPEETVFFESVANNNSNNASLPMSSEIIDEEEIQEVMPVEEIDKDETSEALTEIEIQNESQEKTENVEEDIKENVDKNIDENIEKSQNKPQEAKKEEQDEQLIKEDSENIDISDEELDFFELAEDTAELEKQENVIINDVEYKVKSDNFDNDIKEENKEEKEEDIDLSEVATNAVESNFEEIINTKTDVNKPTFKIDEKTTIQVDLNSKNENLPVFKDKEEQDDSVKYEVGDVVIHKKYGKGTIVKIMQYDQRQLLHIDFVDSGKKLLDPKIAEIELVQ